jgi:polyferredoxin
MKKKAINRLKTLRVIPAILLFTSLLLYFLDIADLLPDHPIGKTLLQIQLMPAVFTGAVTTLLIYLLLTLLFGRLYCSVICPAGILQDLFNRISYLGKKKKAGKQRFRYRKPANRLRYILLALTVILALLGLTELCLLLDPYSNFGRIAANLLRPAVVRINNLTADILSSQGNYSLYHITIRTSTAAWISAVAALLLLFIMSYLRGRLFCNTLCPVGALLSLVSRHSLFRITFDRDKCNHCRRCEKSCKAEAIDSANMTVDTSSCVTCFNCTSACNRNSLKYGFVPLPAWKKRNAAAAAGKSAAECETISGSRRSFITSSAALAGSVPLMALAGNDPKERPLPVTPPGSLSIERFRDLCTGCHICVVQCPTHILHPAGLKYGWGYLLKPHMSYENSYCNYSCTICSDVCPTDAIKPISVEDKKVIQIGVANFYKDLCVVYTDENDCGACSEHCPSQAVHMVPYKGTLTIPRVEADLCVGCGGCESICPVRPTRAIVVISNPVHQTAQLPEKEDVKSFDVDDFGF